MQNVKTVRQVLKIFLTDSFFNGFFQSTVLFMLFHITALFQASKIKNGKGKKDFYVDGGVLCNYPVHAFDGKAFCQLGHTVLTS